jgi:phosphoribosyl-dephospho-CoA transferase
MEGITVRPHDLLRLASPPHVVPDGAPAWVAESLRAAPWVVARRATASPRQVAAGVRGPARAQRFALQVPVAAIRCIVTPEELAVRAGAAGRDLPALRALRAAAALLEGTGLPWGPVGSTGFELATGIAAVTPASDLDLVIRSAPLPPPEILCQVRTALSSLPARTDCLIETSEGAMALEELTSGAAEVLLRAAGGPRLIRVPWRLGA